MNNVQLKNVQHDFEVEVGDVGVTVRLGDKWFDAYRAALQQKDKLVVALWECPEGHTGTCTAHAIGCHYDGPICLPHGTAEVVGAWRGKLIDIPTGLLDLEHEATSREFKGLYASLRRGYGDAITAESRVTALLYERLSVA